MQGSTILNQRQHVGLQQLSALAGIATQYLGPNKTYKFIQEESSGESTLVNSCFRVLESLELTCAVGQLIYETIEAHHRVYKTGSGCLLFMAGVWSRAALECLHRGIPITHIISAMSEGMDICLSVCKQYSIPIKALRVTPTGTSMEHFSLENAKDSAKLTPRSRKLKLSRHFCEPESENIPSSVQTFLDLQELANIAETLSHGCSDTMNLVVRAIQIQFEQDLSFDVSKVLTCSLPGLPEEHSCVLPGCIVLVSPEQALVTHHLKGLDLKVALIDGDLTSTYRHLGFHKPKGLQHVADQSDLASLGKEEGWLERALRLVLNLEVKLMLISGVANEKLMQHFWRRNILIVEKVKLSVLKAFAKATGAVLVPYATQLSSHCIGTGLTVDIWKDLENKRKSQTALNICCTRNNGLVTAVLTSCVQVKLQSLEDQFWTCAYRLHWALKDKALLSGAGATEMLCIQCLQQQPQLLANIHSAQQINLRTAATPYSGVVLHLMADGLMDYICTVMVNTGKYSKVQARTAVAQRLQDCDGSVRGVVAKFSQLFLEGDAEDSGAVGKTICDNFIVKQEAWRKALDIVFLVLQTDAEIITGVDPKTVGARKELMLL